MFRIIECSVYSHPVLGDLELRLSDTETTLTSVDSHSNHTTMIIGRNGTGKSQILLAIIEIFNYSISRWKKQGAKQLKYNFHIVYSLNTLEYSISYNMKKIKFSSPEAMVFPSRIIISAFCFNDKYPLSGSGIEDTNQVYRYLGLKSTTNSIFIKNPTKLLVDSLQRIISSNEYTKSLRDLLMKLHFDDLIEVEFGPGKNYNVLMNYLKDVGSNNNSTRELFNNLRMSLLKYKRFANDKIMRILDSVSTMTEISSFIDMQLRSNKVYRKSSLIFKTRVNLKESESYDKFISDLKALKMLSDLEMLKYNNIILNRIDNGIDFDYTSSGEYHLIMTYLNIISNIDKNALILIDEPEISLHPNWQIKYMTLMDSLFNGNMGSHFVIASHSHFMVSDLHPKKTSMISLFLQQNGKIETRPVSCNTYGWSAEQILLEVFNVSTSRNYYLHIKISEILKLLAEESPNINNIKSLINDVLQIDFSLVDNDPLAMVLQRLRKIKEGL